MTNPQDEGTRVTKTVPAIVYQRLGSAAAGLVESGEFWVTIEAQGKAATREPKTGTQPPTPAKDADHIFAVAGQNVIDAGRATVVNVRLTVRRADGTTEEISLDGEGKYDAFFWGLGAIRKFVAPYYCATLGPEYAFAILRAYANDPTIAGICHTPTSEDCSRRSGSITSMEKLVDAAVSFL